MKIPIVSGNNSRFPHIAAVAAALSLAAGTEHASARALGIDSDFNCCSVTWSSVAGSGVQFACIKATQQDAGFQNNVFGNRMQGAQGAGIYTIPYNRVNPATYTPSSEAAYFWNVAGPYIHAGGYNLSPAVDIEDGLTGSYKKDGGGTQSLAAWINQYYNDLANDAAADGVNIQKLAYVNVGSTCYIGSGMNGLLWLADPCGCNPQTGSPYTCGGCSVSGAWDGCLPIGSETWSIWQYEWSSQQSSPPYPGLSERVDLDVYNGSISQMVSALGTSSAFGGVAFKPSSILYGNGHEEVFALQYTGYAPWHATDSNTIPGTTWNEGWLGNNGQFRGSSAVVPVLNINGNLEIFAVDTSGQYFMNAWNTGEGTAWSSWAQIGSSGYVGNPAVLGRPDGGVEAFVHTTAGGSVAHFSRPTFSSPWASSDLGGSIGSDPTVILNTNNYVQVFAVDGSGNLVNRWNTGPGTAWNSGGWVGITGGSGCSGRPAAVVRADGGVEVFVRRSSDGVVKHFYHPNFSATWSNDTLNSGVTYGSNLSAVENAGPNHQMEVFGITAAGNLWHVSNSGPGTSWGSWSQITTGTALFSDPCAMVNANGSVEVFARIASNNALGHVWNSGAGTAWGTFSSFQGPQ
jgi:hypothetical protein